MAAQQSDASEAQNPHVVAEQRQTSEQVDESHVGDVILSPDMKKKILYGQLKQPNKTEIIGGHSPQISNNNSLFAVEDLSNNEDGTKEVKFVKDLLNGKISKIKKSTLFPSDWSDDKIIKSVMTVAHSSEKGLRTRDNATWHRENIDGIDIDVIKLGNIIVSAYPTGGVPNRPLVF